MDAVGFGWLECCYCFTKNRNYVWHALHFAWIVVKQFEQFFGWLLLLLLVQQQTNNKNKRRTSAKIMFRIPYSIHQNTFLENCLLLYISTCTRNKQQRICRKKNEKKNKLKYIKEMKINIKSTLILAAQTKQQNKQYHIVSNYTRFSLLLFLSLLFMFRCIFILTSLFSIFR